MSVSPDTSPTDLGYVIPTVFTTFSHITFHDLAYGAKHGYLHIKLLPDRS